MRAQKVNFIFVEKDPWYKKVVNGLSGRSGNSRYGCSVHGFNTDSSKYKFSNALSRKASKRPLSMDGVAFSDDEPPYPQRRTKSPVTKKSEGGSQRANNAHKQPQRAVEQNQPQYANTQSQERKALSPMNEDRRSSVARPPQQIVSQTPWEDEKPATYSTRQSAPPQASPLRQQISPQQELIENTKREASIRKNPRDDKDIADKLSAAFDDYDAREQSLGMSATMLQEDIREKTQDLKKRAKQRFETASQDDRSITGRAKKAYERTSERMRESKQSLMVWGVGSAIGFVVVFGISLIIVNANF
jgi:ElaB/YqjD/DUF883 family membrane-anchored ribosome-binding protein